MSDEPRHTNDVLPVADHQACERVSRILEANSSDASALKRRKEAAPHQARVAHGLPVEIREDEIVRTVGAGLAAVLLLPQEKSREREAPIRGARLRFLKTDRFPSRPSTWAGINRSLLVSGAVALIAGHGVILSYVSHHLRLSVWVVGSLVTLVLLKHVGLVGVLPAWLRGEVHRSRSKHSDNGAARATSQSSD